MPLPSFFEVTGVLHGQCVRGIVFWASILQRGGITVALITTLNRKRYQSDGFCVPITTLITETAKLSIQAPPRIGRHSADVMAV